MARPTKYKKEFIDKIDEYLEPFLTGEINELPTRYDFSRLIGVNDDTLVEWEKKKDDRGNLVYPKFSAAIKKIDKTQRRQLMNHGAYGGKEVNSTMCIFLLKCNHGMSETKDVENRLDELEKLLTGK